MESEREPEEPEAVPKHFLNPTIRTDPELKPDPDYKPQYVNFPIEWKDIEVVFTNDEFMRFWTCGEC